LKRKSGGVYNKMKNVECVDNKEGKKKEGEDELVK